MAASAVVFFGGNLETSGRNPTAEAAILRIRKILAHSLHSLILCILPQSRPRAHWRSNCRHTPERHGASRRFFRTGRPAPEPVASAIPLTPNISIHDQHNPRTPGTRRNHQSTAQGPRTNTIPSTTSFAHHQISKYREICRFRISRAAESTSGHERAAVRERSSNP
ncbi:MAG: hypothetical protein JWN70_2499 [Planctomycetaceae bacterium]|nr:hypothetical protein [Planctomycetaceae bacterium]